MIKIKEEDLEGTLDIYEDVGLIISTQSNKIFCIEILQDLKRALTGDDKGWVHVWDLDSLSLTFKFKAHEKWVYRLLSEMNLNNIISSSEDCYIKVWNWTNYDLINSIKLEFPVFCSIIIPDQDLLISGCKWGHLKFFNLSTLVLKSSSKLSHREIWALDLSKSNEYLSICCFDKKSFLYNLPHFLPLKENNHSSSVTSSLILNNLSSYLTGEMNGKLTKFNMIDNARYEIQANDDSIRFMVLSMDECKVFVASSNSSVKVFGTEELDLKIKVKVHDYYAHCLAVCHEKNYLISCGWDGYIKILDYDNLNQKSIFLNHVSEITQFFLTDDFSNGLTLDCTGHLKSWNLVNKKCNGDIFYRKNMNVEKAKKFKRLVLVVTGMDILVFSNKIF